MIPSLVLDEQGPTACSLDSEPTPGISASRMVSAACCDLDVKGLARIFLAFQALDSAETRAWRTQKNLGVPAKRSAIFMTWGSRAPARAGSRCRSIFGSFHNEAIPRSMCCLSGWVVPMSPSSFECQKMSRYCTVRGSARVAWQLQTRSYGNSPT